MATKYVITVNPSCRQFAALIEEVTRQGFSAGSEVIYNERNELRRIPKEQTTGEMDVNVKAFHLPSFPNNFIYRFLRKGKARRSYENALKLQKLGFRTPAPMGYGEEHTGGAGGALLARSYYFCEHLPYENARQWELRDDFDEFVPAFAAEIARLHRAGVWFHDFSQGNILINKIGKGQYEFYYVDLNRMEFDVHNPKKLFRMFKTISWNFYYLEQLGKAYARVMNLPEQETVEKVQRQARQWQNRHFFKERVKMFLRLKKR